MLKNEKLVHRLTIREKLSLILSDELYKSGSVSGYSFPTFELTNNPFNGVRNIKCTNYPSQRALAMTWNNDLIQRTSYFLGIENSIFTPNPFFNVSCKLDRNYISDDPYILSNFSKSFIEGLSKSFSYTCIESGNKGQDEIYNKEMLDLPLYNVLSNGNEDFILVNSLEEMFDLTKEYDLKKTFFAKTNGIKEIARFINNGVYLIFFEGDKEKYLDKLEVYVKNGQRLAGQLKNGAIDKREYDSFIENGEAIGEDLLASCVDNYIEMLLNIEKKKKKTISESKYLDDKNELPFDYVKHNEKALEAAKEAIVLLKNDHSLLPIKSTTKVAVVGDVFSNLAYYKEFFNHESSMFNAPVDAITDYLELSYIGYAHGYVKGKSDTNLLTSMVSLVNDSDVTLFFMMSDSATNEIPEEQLEALVTLHVETDKPVICVLLSDKYVDLSFQDKCDALILCPNIGQNLSKVIFDCITGEINPNGRLISDYPVLVGENEHIENYPGYTLTDYPKFYPLGYGLSYSNFEYENLVISENGVIFSITNNSEFDGFEVPQIYIKKSGNSSLSHRLLRGYTKVFVKAHCTERVCIEFDDFTFRNYSEKSRCFGVEGGEYSIYVGPNSDNVKLEGTLHLSKYLDRTDLYETKELKNDIQTKHDFDNLEENIRSLRTGLKFFVSLLIMIYALGMIAFAFYMIYLSGGKAYKFWSYPTYTVAGISFLIIMAFVLYNVVIMKKRNKLIRDYENSDRTLYEMIDCVSDFDVKNDIVFDTKDEIIEEVEEKLVVEEVKEEVKEEEPVRYQEIPKETEVIKEKDEQLIDIVDVKLSDEDIALQEEEELARLENEVDNKNTEFDEREENLSFDENSSIQKMIDKFVEYSESKGVIVETSCVRSIFSSIGSSKLIFINSKLKELLPEFLMIFRDYMGSQSYITRASDEWTNPYNLCWEKDEKGSYSKTPFINDLYNACKFKKSLNFLFLSNVNMANVDKYLKDFIEYGINPMEPHRLKINASQSLRIPENLNIIMIPTDDSYMEHMSKKMSDACVCIELILRRNENVDPEKVVTPEIISKVKLEELINESKEFNFLPEEAWKKLDNLENEINKKEEFQITNKMTLSIERYTAFYLECGGDMQDCLDSILAERIIPIIKKTKTYSSVEGQRELIELCEKFFGEDNIAKTKRVVKLEN